MIKDEYETERLILHLSNPDMTSEITNYLIRNRKFLSNIEPKRPEEYYTEDYQRKILLDESLFVYGSNQFKFWITKKGESRVIGNINLNGVIKGSFSSCFISFRRDKDEVGKGFMLEAIIKGIDIAFNDIGLHRIEANIMPSNELDLDLCRQIGFYEEGLAKKYLKINGVWEDHIHMVLLNE